MTPAADLRFVRQRTKQLCQSGIDESLRKTCVYVHPRVTGASARGVALRRQSAAGFVWRRSGGAWAAGFTALQGQYLAFIGAYSVIHGVAPAEADIQRFVSRIGAFGPSNGCNT
jgi:hypothetical protein